MKFKNDLGNILTILETVYQNYNSNSPVSINLTHDRKLAVQNIHLDLTEGGVEILFEADLESKSECSKEISISSTDGILETLVGNKAQSDEGAFLYDYDKLVDFCYLTRREFLDSYLYISEKEYKETEDRLLNDDTEIVLELFKKLLEEAEYLSEHEDKNYWNVSGEEMKKALWHYAENNYSRNRREELKEKLGNANKIFSKRINR